MEDRLFRAWPPFSYFPPFYSFFVNISHCGLSCVCYSCTFSISSAGMSSFALESTLTTPSEACSYLNTSRATSGYDLFSFSLSVSVQVVFPTCSASTTLPLTWHAVPSNSPHSRWDMSVSLHVAL